MITEGLKKANQQIQIAQFHPFVNREENMLSSTTLVGVSRKSRQIEQILLKINPNIELENKSDVVSSELKNRSIA